MISGTVLSKQLCPSLKVKSGSLKRAKNLIIPQYLALYRLSYHIE